MRVSRRKSIRAKTASFLRSKGLTPEEIERTYGIPLPKRTSTPPSPGKKDMGRKIVKTAAQIVPPEIRAPVQLSLPTAPTSEEIVVRRKIEKINNNRICVINQLAELADILFCEPIARMYHDDGYKIIWPIESKFFNLNKHFPYIIFVNKELLQISYEHKNFYNTDNMLIVPLRWAGEILRGQQMESKYKLCGLPTDTWKNTQWQRDQVAEQELFSEILQLDDTPYNLINEVQIVPPNNLRNVYVERISDYTPLDWSKVIENASNLYTTNGFINYILDKITNPPNVVFSPARMEILR